MEPAASQQGGGWGQKDKSCPRDGDRTVISAHCPQHGVVTPFCLLFLPVRTVLGPLGLSVFHPLCPLDVFVPPYDPLFFSHIPWRLL